MKNQSVLSRIISFLSFKTSVKILNVLSDVSFDVNKGEILGLIGKNGSGKSTLLRIISGIYDSDEGSVESTGKIVSLIGLGQGLKDRLTMRENIYLVCSLFGLSRKTVKKRFNSIVKFAELKDFVDTKLFQFSSGMVQRLAFSIAIHSDPEILLLDEVFEVGDKDFKKKSKEKLKELVKGGASIVLVSHELGMIREHCDKVVWLKDGMVKYQGDTEYVLSKY
ncbi:ABC transporter ATP-binding protein [Candidatus Woesearchaeota archaeon]|nr:ABC transporter ATP-binding protein [Candidatus Woesearchaeota archaeon]